jgi:putative transposase
VQTTTCIKLLPSEEQRTALLSLMAEMAAMRTMLARFCAVERCTNRQQLHHLAYYDMRELFPSVGSQMTCIAIREVAAAHKTQLALGNISKKKAFPVLQWSSKGSVAFDARTMRYDDFGNVSLYTQRGRTLVPMVVGSWQKDALAQGAAREAKVVCKRGRWYLHVSVQREKTKLSKSKIVMGVDVGESNIAATSTNKILGGKQLRHERERHLALRSRLQSQGTKSAKQRLVTVSGRENRHVRHVNHVTSKALVAEAIKSGAGTIAMEDLTHIRDRIRMGKRMRGRLHRWAWRQLQTFVEYKAGLAGLRVIYVDPAYTSQTCSRCLCLGGRGTGKHRSRFVCACGNRQHADANAARNISRLPGVITSGTGHVTVPNVA